MSQLNPLEIALLQDDDNVSLETYIECVTNADLRKHILEIREKAALRQFISTRLIVVSSSPASVLRDRIQAILDGVV